MKPKQSEIESGIICRRCYKYIMSKPRGWKRLCPSCRDHFDRMKEIDSPKRIKVRRKWKDKQIALYGPYCPKCKKKFHGVKAFATVDHIIPVSKGGLDKPCNWQLLCSKCNNEKGDTVIFPPPGFKRGSK